MEGNVLLCSVRLTKACSAPLVCNSIGIFSKHITYGLLIASFTHQGEERHVLLLFDRMQ